MLESASTSAWEVIRLDAADSGVSNSLPEEIAQRCEGSSVLMALATGRDLQLDADDARKPTQYVSVEAGDMSLPSKSIAILPNDVPMRCAPIVISAPQGRCDLRFWRERTTSDHPRIRAAYDEPGVVVLQLPDGEVESWGVLSPRTRRPTEGAWRRRLGLLGQQVLVGDSGVVAAIESAWRAEGDSREELEDRLADVSCEPNGAVVEQLTPRCPPVMAARALGRTPIVYVGLDGDSRIATIVLILDEVSGSIWRS